MTVALDTNAYSDFMRGVAERVELVRTVPAIVLPLIVLAELRAGFAAGNQESANAANLQRFLASPRVSVLAPDEQTTHHYARLHRQLRGVAEYSTGAGFCLARTETARHNPAWLALSRWPPSSWHRCSRRPSASRVLGRARRMRTTDGG